MSKVRIWIMGFLFFVYLVVVGFLSAVSLHESHINPQSSRTYSNHRNEDSRTGGIEYKISPYRQSKKFRIDWCADLQFLKTPKEPVALASFPGSGNTWLRYLLQQATGLYTGSVYKDYGLLKSGFPAESISNGSVLVVKTHEWGVNVRKCFSKAVLLVRAPAAAIQAEFNRQNGGHLGFASIDRYTKTRGKYWTHFVNEKLKIWKKMNLDWLYNFTGPTHILFYEQLVDNVEETLKTVLNFLDIPISESFLSCAVERREGIYRRKSRTFEFDPYTTTMKQQLQLEEEKLYAAIKSAKRSQIENLV